MTTIWQTLQWTFVHDALTCIHCLRIVDRVSEKKFVLTIDVHRTVFVVSPFVFVCGAVCARMGVCFCPICFISLFQATAVHDVQAGSPLTISLGDPSNPTPLFAKYGFLYNDCTTIFCKAMHLLPEIETLGYDFKDLLFETTTGNIAPKVWDIFLYKLLENADETGDMAAQFYVACKTNDEDTKQNFLNQYFPYVLDAVKNHVDGILQDIDVLTNKAQSYNIQTHPRVPVIVAHNNLVKDTFQKVQQQLYNMG